MQLKKIMIIIICIIFACVQNKNESGSLSGSLIKIKDGTILSIVDLEADQVLQKVEVFNGKFKTKFSLSVPRFIGIWGENPKYPKDRFLFWLENSKISIRGNYEYFDNSTIQGSNTNKIYLKHETIKKIYERDFNRLRILKSRTSNKRILDSIAEASDIVLSKYREAKINFYTSEINSPVALYFLSRQFVEPEIPNADINVLTKKDIEMIYNMLPNNFKNTEKGELIKEYISLPETPKEGERFIDFLQEATDGGSVSVAENLGRFTILEFWSSNCGNCRAEHPSLRQIYKKYHNKGLNIIGISADTDKDDWLNAIKADSLPWLNLCDLKGIYNKAFMIYGINYIPQLILIDKNGIIVDNKLGSKFPHEREIEERFQQNGL